jgi:hypothetical protein
MAQGHTNGIDICTVLKEEFHNIDVVAARSHMQGSLAIVSYSPDVNGLTQKSRQRHTHSFDIRAKLKEEFHNLNLAIERSHEQGSSLEVAFGRDVNGGDLEIRSGTYP